MLLLIPVLAFVGAALPFWLQPLLAKSLLPLLGGAPGVWNICMVCFQALLLGGYLYAHLLSRLQSRRFQMAIHTALLVAGAASLQLPPLALNANQVPPNESPELWLLRVVLRSVGGPFLVLCATSPLLQRWWPLAANRSTREPFFLYAISNAGSLMALLGFPFVLEPRIPIRMQFVIWETIYQAVTLGFAVCAVVAWRRKETDDAPSCNDEEAGGVPTWGQRVRWITLALVPSSLLLGSTTRITTDVASVPLLWVVPLAVYLASFVVVFSRRGTAIPAVAVRATPGLAVALVLLIEARVSQPAWLLIMLHVAFLGAAALACHGRLAAARPSPAHLTSFYLCLALGGVLGGSFNALLAPKLFTTVAEYPLMLLLACLLARPSAEGPAAPGSRALDVAYPFGLAVVAVGLALVASQLEWQSAWLRDALVIGVPALVAFMFAARPLRFTLGLAAVMAGGFVQSADAHHGMHAVRNFFGICRVSIDPDGRFRRFIHGNTLHGRQFIDPARACEPVAYYGRAGPFGQIMRQFQGVDGTRNVAVVGLGAGASAVYGKAGETWTFYEIDPAVAAIAQNTNMFTFLNGCTAARWRIVLGDARLRLREAPPHGYRLIVVDAFSSDAIPVHLLTREAMDIYLRALAPDGMIAIHISNRSLNLAPVVAGLAQASRLTGRRWNDDRRNAAEGTEPSDWVVLARREADLRPGIQEADWKPLEDSPGARPWTDDFSNPWTTLKWRWAAPLTGVRSGR